MKIGIDKIGFYGPPYYVDMVDLANERGDDPSKYTIGIGQAQMAVAPLSQDIVSMAVNAALVFLDDEDRAKIDLVVVGTESGFDASKSASVYVHELLGIQPHARSFEVKQACYGATAGIQMAKDYVTLHPDRCRALWFSNGWGSYARGWRDCNVDYCKSSHPTIRFRECFLFA